MSNTDKAEKAYQQREALDWPLVAPYAQMMGGADFVKQERRKNFHKAAAEFPEITEIVKVEIMPTMDGHSTVTLIGVDGNRCTLWLVGPLPVAHGNTSLAYSTDEVTRNVRGITNY
jgi:hypothetical protein